MDYLLGITVGPVQTYIEQSRKLIDLRNSSKIISDIMQSMCKKILEKNRDNEIIYPNHGGIKDVDYSNYMIFLIKDKINIEHIKNIVYEEIENNVCKRIECIYSLKEIFYMFWAMTEIEKTYKDSYEELTKLIYDLKNTYEFDQFIQRSSKKCLICGKRNIINLEKKKRKIYNVKVNEELCELCLFKRNYKSKQDFQSVYKIAISNWLEIYKDNLVEVNNILNRLFNTKDIGCKYYDNCKVDNILKLLKNTKKQFKSGDCLFDDILKKMGKNTIISKKLKELNEELNDNLEGTTLNNLIRQFEELNKKLIEVYNCKDKSIDMPNYEYCFIQMDIDNLGYWISGKYFEDNNDEDINTDKMKSKLYTYQKELSSILIKFASKLKNELEEKCNIIYSGGDDFLSILPIENIIHVVNIIDKMFKIEVQDKVEKLKDEYILEDEQITYSISITIAQCKDPMSYALNTTRIQLNNVKNRYINKDGVVINYIINNSKEITCYLKKNTYKELIDLVTMYNNLDNKLSFSYINNFYNEFKTFNFENITHAQLKNMKEMMQREFERLLTRSKNKYSENNKEKDTYINNYINELTKIFKTFVYENKYEMTPNDYILDLNNIIHILRINQKFIGINKESGVNNIGG